VSLSTTIKSIQDIMRKDVGVDGDAQRIGQLVWLLFLKIWDDREQELALIEDGFRSPLMEVRWQDTEPRQAPDLRWSAWASAREGLTGDELLSFVNNTLFPALKNLDPGIAVPLTTGWEQGEARQARALYERRRLLKETF